MYFYITLVFAFGYFIESIFGFAGTIIAFSILAFFIDIKELIFIALFYATFTSFIIIITDIKSISKQKILQMLKTSIPGIIIGSMFLDYLSSNIILKLLGIFLIFFSIWSFLPIKKNNTPKKLFLLISGIFQGTFGTGGPLAISAMKNDFDNKSQLRTTFALFFIILNIIRGIQYFIQNTFNYSNISEFIWFLPIILMTTLLGHKVHLKISQKYFENGIYILLLVSGIFLFFK